jgi:hypothetical protein
MLRFQELCFGAVIFVAATTGAAQADNTSAAPAGSAPTGSAPTGGTSSGSTSSGSTSSGSTSSGSTPEVASQTSEKDAVQYGVGIRLRNVRGPKGLIGLFVESSPGGISEIGYGVDLIRRRGNTELQLGFELEHLQPAEGVWIQSNTDVSWQGPMTPGDEADYIVSPKHNPKGDSLGWATIEFTFINHAELGKHLALRYGGGLGIGIVTGSLWRYNVVCSNGSTNANPEPGCVPPDVDPNGTATLSSTDGNMMIQKYNLPPVFPVVNAILGLQIRPFSKATINIEGGIRTFPFFGASGAFFF